LKSTLTLKLELGVIQGTIRKFTSNFPLMFIVTMALSWHLKLISKNTPTLKSRSEVTQAYQNWYHSIACLWFPT